MIDCDQVFDVLTRGPFPTGAASDAAVESHLGICSECARLAAALRPAIELFQEAIGPDEGRDLPSYWGEVAVELSEPTVACSDQMDEEPSVSRGRQQLTHYWQRLGEFTSLNVWRVAAAVAFGVLVGSVFRSLAPWESFRSPIGGAPSMAQSPPDESSALLALPTHRYDVWARLHVACVADMGGAGFDEPTGGGFSSPGQWVERPFDQLDCCTRCHSAGRRTSFPGAATAAVMDSCRYCHDSKRSVSRGSENSFRLDFRKDKAPGFISG